MYYMYPTRLTVDELDKLVTDQNYVTKLFSTYYSNLVPVRYSRASTH